MRPTLLPISLLIFLNACAFCAPSAWSQIVQRANELDEATAASVKQLRGRKLQSFPPLPAAQIRRLSAVHTDEDITIDGALTEAAWRQAKRSTPFVDLVTGRPVAYSTQVALRWDADNLYVGYWVEEPDVRAKFKERDKPIWQDNDVELFLAFDHAYYELELNAFNTVYEGLFVWKESYDAQRFDLASGLNIRDPAVQHQPFNGVGYTKHPRGPRLAFLAWDYPGLRSAVKVQGVINDQRERDEGWTVELALPWSGMKTIARGDKRPIPPRPGDVWRMDFSRFNQYHAAMGPKGATGPTGPKGAKPARPSPKPLTTSNSAVDSGGWALSHHGVWDSHIPEAFPYVEFTK